MKPIPLQYKDITCTLCNKILGIKLKQQRYGGKRIHEAYTSPVQHHLINKKMLICLVLTAMDYRSNPVHQRSTIFDTK